MAFQFGAALAAFLAASANPGATTTPPPAVVQQAVPLIESGALRAMISSGVRFMLVDVRQPDEFAAGHIEGAMLLPLDTLEANLAKLPRNVKLVVYCRSGHRSAKAVTILMAHGYDRAVSLNGGFLAWQAR
jgi:rhodanese-related sulfurtransferase